jgi:hypothetical protein
VLNRNSRGNSFCQVDKRRHKCQFKPDITLGNQKWRGAAPAFIINLRAIISFGRARWGSDKLDQTALVNKSREPRVWARKYLVAASYSLLR